MDSALARKRRFGEVVKMWDAFIEAHPDDPRPYVERGGAKWHLRRHEAAIADMQKACDLGLSKACADIPRVKSRLPE